MDSKEPDFKLNENAGAEETSLAANCEDPLLAFTGEMDAHSSDIWEMFKTYVDGNWDLIEEASSTPVPQWPNVPSSYDLQDLSEPTVPDSSNEHLETVSRSANDVKLQSRDLGSHKRSYETFLNSDAASGATADRLEFSTGPPVSKSDAVTKGSKKKQKAPKRTGDRSKKNPSNTASKAERLENQSLQVSTWGSAGGEYDLSTEVWKTFMLGDNVFTAAENNQANEDQPMFDATQRAKAISQIRKTVPKSKKSEVDRLEMALKGIGRSIAADGNGKWKLRYLNLPLDHYQVDAIFSMHKRENVRNAKPHGGLVAYQMGLGKTIMMLATMILGKIEKTDKIDKTGPTLIVAPASILCQWREEIESHVSQEFFPDVFNQYGQFKLLGFGRDNAPRKLSACDIILTSYNEVARSYPKEREYPKGLETEAEKSQWWQEICEKESGPLHKIKFLRVVLDESQAIKNHKSQTSKACCALDSRFRWCMSGTPVPNNNFEFYAYFSFLQVPNIRKPADFKKKYCREKDMDCTKHLIYELAPWTIRKTHADDFVGAKLANLPKPREINATCHLSPVERDIYNIVETRFKKTIGSMKRQKGSLGVKEQHFIFSMILRLRQLLDHPLLIQDTMIDMLEEGDFLKLEKMIRASQQPNQTENQILQGMRSVLDHQYQVSDTPDTKGDLENRGHTPETSGEQGNHAGDNIGHRYGATNDIGPFLQTVKKEKEERSSDPKDLKFLCVVCRKPPEDPMRLACGHFGCNECFNTGSCRSTCPTESKDVRCLECGSTSERRPFKEFEIRPDLTKIKIEGAQLVGDGTSKKRRTKEQKKDFYEEWLGNEKAVLSTKTMAVKCQILEWMKEDPNVKIIIYTLFLDVVRIFNRVCQMEGWHTLQFYGGMNLQSRDSAIKEFGKSNGSCILLATLGAGSVGLNLTMASRVVMMDMWWNSALEDQAFCRTYRRGQTKETVLWRPVVANTIDERIIQLKQSKENETGLVLKPDEKPSVTIVELMRLFE